MEFKNKNDYSVAVFTSDNIFLVKMEYVHTIYACTQWLTKSEKYRNWGYINVYARRTNRFIKRYYVGNYIDSNPK